MDRRNTYFRQLCTESEVDEWFADVETALDRVLPDLGLTGVFAGLAVAEDSPASLEVSVSAGLAIAPDGKRIRLASGQTVDVSVDYLGVPTTVATSGNEKWLSLYIAHDRSLQDPRTDGAGSVIYYDRLDSWRFQVVQGTESATPTRPALLSDAVLLADVSLAFGQTSITTSDLDTSRRMLPLKIAGSPIALAASTLAAAFAAILDVVNPHVAGTGQYHPASVIQYNGSAAFADPALVLGSSGVEAALDSIVSIVGASGATGGDDAVGVRSDATQSPTLPGGTLRARLVALRLASNLAYAGSPAFADTTTIPASSVEAAIDALVTALTSTSGNRGAGKITAPAVSGSPTALSADTIAAQLAALLAAVNTAAAATTALAAALAATTDGADGAGAVGAEEAGALEAGTVRSQLDALASRTAVAWGRLATNGSGGVSIVDHEGIASANVTSTQINVTFATPFANTSFAPFVSSIDGSTNRAYKASVTGVDTIAIFAVDPVTNVSVNPATSLCALAIEAKGRV